MMWGKSKENGIWLAPSGDWRLMFWRHDALFIAAGRLRLRLMKCGSPKLPSTSSGPPPDWKQDQAETSCLPREPEARYTKRDREHIERGLSDASNSLDPALAADARRALDAFRSSTTATTA
jgi:hypothetical protein